MRLKPVHDIEEAYRGRNMLCTPEDRELIGCLWDPALKKCNKCSYGKKRGEESCQKLKPLYSETRESEEV